MFIALKSNYFQSIYQVHHIKDTLLGFYKQCNVNSVNIRSVSRENIHLRTQYFPRQQQRLRDVAKTKAQNFHAKYHGRTFLSSMHGLVLRSYSSTREIFL